MKGRASAGLRDRTNQRLWRKLRKKSGYVMPEAKNQSENNSWYRLWYITAAAATAGCLVHVVFQMSRLLSVAVFVSAADVKDEKTAADTGGATTGSLCLYGYCFICIYEVREDQ